MLSIIVGYILRLYYYFFDRYVLYPLMQIIPRHFEIKFMNLGYSPCPYSVEERNLGKDETIRTIVDKVVESNDSNKPHYYLYEKALSMCPEYPLFDDFKIAEIGCGLGGGVEWIKRAHPEIQNAIGIDKVIHSTEDGTFFEGNAEDIPLPSASFDLVINVESSHLYDNPKMFFAEVRRILKPNGYFCWADLRYENMMAKTLEEVSQAKLHLTSYENITAEVLNGIEFTSRRYDKMLNKAPWFIKIFRDSIRATYCAPGTHTYNRFASREKIYAAACWCKKE